MSRIAPALPLAALLALLPAAALAHGPGLNHKPSWLGDVTSRTYDGVSDDLLTAGLGKSGLQVALSLVGLDPADPAVIRRVAIHTNYRAIVDTTAGGGYGTLYGPNVLADGSVTTGEGKIAGSEHLAYADDRDGGRVGETSVTMMVQVPASFDPKRPCIVTGTSSGSRGVYGAIGSSGEWGLKRGCAVAYTDKGTGNGIHDLQANTVSLQNGVRADAAAAGDGSNFTARLTDLQRQTFNAATPNRFAVKHAHSQRNPERDWGRDTLRAVEFAFWVLNEQFGRKLPNGQMLRTITKRDTIVIASSVSNGAGAALAAAEEDREGLIDGVAVSEPNIQVGFAPHPVIRRGSLVYRDGSRPLYDYFTFANLYQPCAARSTRAAGSPLAINPALNAFIDNRCTSLAQRGLLATTTLPEQYEEAMDRLLAYGWEPDTVLLHSSHWNLATPSITMTYSNAHGRFSVADNLCGLSFAATDAGGAVSPVTPGALPFSFGLGNGVPPTVGINMVFNDSVGGARNLFLSTSPTTNRADFGFDTALCQRDLWSGRNLDALRVRVGVAEVQQRADLNGKPAIIVHGRSDTLVPVNFSSRPYYAENQRRERGGSRLRYIEVTNAQHFDAFLPFPGYDARFVPLHVYFNRALDAMWAHLTERRPLPPSQVVRTTPRGAPVAPAVVAPPITAANVPPIAANPPAADRITFSGNTLTIPD